MPAIAQEPGGLDTTLHRLLPKSESRWPYKGSSQVNVAKLLDNHVGADKLINILLVSRGVCIPGQSTTKSRRDGHLQTTSMFADETNQHITFCKD